MFEKGKSGNAKGKPKGAVNKTTADLRQWITDFINDNKEQLQADWQSLDAKDRILMFEKLLKYALPTLQATSLATDFNAMTEEQLNQIINKLINHDAAA